jgi:hypothetical protein
MYPPLEMFVMMEPNLLVLTMGYAPRQWEHRNFLFLINRFCYILPHNIKLQIHLGVFL